MKTILLTGALIAIFHFGLHAQVGINETGAPPHENAGLDVDFTNKGFLPPRLTSEQRDEMTGSIPPGLFIFNTTTNCFEFHLGSIWQTLGCGCVTAPDAPAAFVSSGARNVRFREVHTFVLIEKSGLQFNHFLSSQMLKFPSGLTHTHL